MDRRGLDAPIVEEFGVGYAPDQPNALQAYLSARGFTAEEMGAAGLVVETDRGRTDRFRGRVMFPIRDARGRCVGFGGRTLGDDPAKYVNTPQTDLFDKSGLLYALDRA